MAAGPAVFIENNTRIGSPVLWHLLKTPGGAQTAPTAAKLSQSIKGVNRVSFAEDNFEFADVSWCGAIAVQIWGVASNDHAPTLNLYGWNDNGPGAHIGTVTATFGNFVSEDSANAAPGWHTDPNLHISLRTAFAAATDYRSCDTYVMTLDTEAEIFSDNAATQIAYERHVALSGMRVLAAGGTDTSPEGDFPSRFVVDLHRSNYKYLCVACTALNSATSVGAIFKPIDVL